MAVILPFLGSVVAPTLFLGIFIFFLAWYRLKIEVTDDNKSPRVDEKEEGNDEEACTDCSCGKNKCEKNIQRISIIYGTSTGTAKDFAWKLAEEAENEDLKVDVNNVANIEAEEFLPLEASKKGSVLVFIISTYTEGTPPESANWFYKWLSESAEDFRIQHSLLKGLKFAVLGLGNSVYQDHYNVIGRNCDKFLFKLSGERFLPLAFCDENEDMENDFQHWKTKLVKAIQKKNSTEEEVEDVEEEVLESEEEEEESDSEENGSDNEGLVDLEDLGKVMKKAKDAQNGPKEMLTPSLRQSLSKQGYKLIGSHSGVKICRWTKAMMRGRGGCYKHTFYGIESHRCMETTPSLACANKCVFCWRHHSNPVGTEWKWAMDQPEMILEGALENHYKMIKQMKGVPGVLPERYQEGFDVRHCALSLVGEPIMYPEINKFVELLHSKKISSFLVTNAQFPEAMKAMKPCTQLYVSIDASTKETLKKVDRPLHKDFWERFICSLEELGKKTQRTVYRLTLVKVGA